MTLCTIRKSAILLAVLVAASQAASAQALETAQRGTEIAPFAQYTVLTPDWGTTNDTGYTAGLDYTRFIRSIVQPSVEFRYTTATGQTVNEHIYSTGLKLQTTIHHIRPYFTALAGKGFIDFDHPANGYISDSSVVYSLGGGALFSVGRQINLRLDYTHQNWNIGPETLTPATFGVGFAYRIPFHNGRVE
jgi:hypothetical protein